MMHKAWCSIEEVPYCFPRSSIKFQGHTGWKIDDSDQIWARLLGRSQLLNPSDLPCSSNKYVLSEIFDKYLNTRLAYLDTPCVLQFMAVSGEWESALSTIDAGLKFREISFAYEFWCANHLGFFLIEKNENNLATEADVMGLLQDT